jgi:hypothetical protein
LEFDWTKILRGDRDESERGDSERRSEPERKSGKVELAPRPSERREPAPAVEQFEEESPSEQPADAVATDLPIVEDDRPLTAAHARIGSEGVLRLRARYADVIASISDRIQEPARQEELRAQAERLNPDGWVTADEVNAGLEQYEAVFESLRAVVGRRRRRRRGRPGTAKNTV